MDRCSRIQSLRALAEASDHSSTYTIPWQGGHKVLPVVKVRTELPMYRINNGRTRRAQLRYLADNANLPSGFFDDPESPEVQSAQEEILRAMADEENLSELLIQEGQETPAIITFDGFVVNGNRRLCILRQNSKEYIDAVILPVCTGKEIYELELALQMAPETKAEYNWVDELLTVMEGLEVHGESQEQIARRMRTTADEILHLRHRLTIVDQYLMFMGHAGDYHLVPESSEQSFIDLQNQLVSASKTMKEGQKQFYQDATFVGIAKGMFYRDLRKFAKTYRQDPDAFMERAVQNAQDEVSQETPEAGTEADITPDAILDSIADMVPQASGDALAVERDAIKVVSAYRSSSAKLTDLLKTTGEDIDAQRSQEHTAKRPLEALRAVRDALESIDLKTSIASGLSDTGLRRAQHLIGEIELRVAQLRQSVARAVSGTKRR